MKMSNLQIVGVMAMALFLSIAVIVVMPATATTAVSVTRDLPDTVYPGEEFEVSLTQSGFDMNIGGVTETLPEGFKYRGVLSGGDTFFGDETTNNYTLKFDGTATTLIYRVKAGTKEQIENASFNGTWKTLSQEEDKEGVVIGDDKVELGVESTPTPSPSPTATPPSGNGGGNGGDGGVPPTPPAETPAHIALSANIANIPADGVSTSTITASVWDREDWALENLTVNFNTSLGNITASAVIANGTATAILTAGMKEGIANVTAETNLSGDIGIITNTTDVNFTTPGATPTAAVVTPTPTVKVSPTSTETATPSPSPTKKPLIPGFEAVFAIASLFSVAYLVLRRREA